MASLATASTLVGWKGTASAAPPRPHGLQQIIATFGGHCNAAANDHMTNWKYGAWDGGGGSINAYGHSALAREWNLARSAVASTRGGDDKLNYGIGMYDCRKKRGSTQWSTHAWGIAVDTNTYCNPAGNSTWDGSGYSVGGCAGPDYGNAIPDIWKSNTPQRRINFVWGISWDDTHHFQYASGY